MKSMIGLTTDRPYMDHYLIECFGAPNKVTNNQRNLESLSRKFCRKLGVHIVNSFSHKFNPYGITLVLVLSESHFAVHTWPEKGYLVIDMLSCKQIASTKEVEQLATEIFSGTKVIVKKLISNNDK
jgi:S-adenosylmethionine decarboxylase